jgi:hypothetical protein
LVFPKSCLFLRGLRRSSQKVTDRSENGGPNDGLTLLGDELLPNGIAEIDYAAADIEVKLVALANVVAEMLWGRWPDEPLIAKLLRLDY